MPGSPGHPHESRAYLSPAEFAAETGLSISTIGRYLKSGRLPKAQPGGPGCRVMIPRVALEPLIADAQSPSSVQDTTVDAKPPCAPEKSPSALSGPQPRWLSRIKQTKEQKCPNPEKIP